MPGTTPQGIGRAAGGVGRGFSSCAIAPAPARVAGSVGVCRLRPRRVFKSPAMTGRFQASGVTRDGAGSAVAGVTVTLYAEGGGPLAWMVSDGAGAYLFDYVGVGSVFVRAWKAGSPDLAGTTLVFAPVSV